VGAQSASVCEAGAMKITAHDTPLTKFGIVNLERVTQGQGDVATQLWYAHVMNEHDNFYAYIPDEDVINMNMEAIAAHIETEKARLMRQPAAYIVATEQKA
jgi:hypothetical protein